FRLSKWLSRSYRRAIEANIRRTRWPDLSTVAGGRGLWAITARGAAATGSRGSGTNMNSRVYRGWDTRHARGANQLRLRTDCRTQEAGGQGASLRASWGVRAGRGRLASPPGAICVKNLGDAPHGPDPVPRSAVRRSSSKDADAMNAKLALVILIAVSTTIRL